MDSLHPHTVLSKLNEQRSQGLFCDVIIVVEDVKFRAHKNILAACSSYFKNALTTETWSSNHQVLELMDLKSEVFACVLNFIYSSKVTSACADSNGELVAAGKKLGISFLAKLSEQERQDKNQNVPESVKVANRSATAVRKHPQEETTRLEEIDGARGPRITNAFSITEVCPGNNPFTPVEEGRQSPDEGQLPASCPTSSSSNGSNETSHTFSEHSYALNQVTEEKSQTGQWAPKSGTLESKQPTYNNTGPLKKRHRLHGAFRNILPTQSEEPHAEKTNPLTSTLAEGAAFGSPLDKNKPKGAVVPLANGHAQMDSNPRTLSPHTEDSISIYGCEQCPEIFTNEALLAVHSEVHKKCSVSHLFCKFCDKKFIHLKRLRNHEQNCAKSVRGKTEQECSDIAVTEVDLRSGSVLRENIRTNLFSVDKPTTGNLLPDQLEPPKAENLKRPNNGQRRYNCSVCKRVYVTLSSLKRHENVHSWQRAYPCHYCNKVFALAEYRTKHEIWHTGERRYQCIFCLETFMTYYILKNHQKSFHGIDPTLAIKRKSANGGLKASVYPIKLYRLLPMKFRKRQYKTYSQTYSEGDDGDYQAPLESNPLSPQLEASNHPDGVALPLTFMATTTTVAPFMPRISVDKPCETNIHSTLYQNYHQKDTEHEGSPLRKFDSVVPLQPDPDASPTDNNPIDVINSHHIGQNVTFLKSLNTVDKLSELSASAKSVEKMTNEMLQSSTEKSRLDRIPGAKTQTYIAKPVCPGPSADGDAIPLCQITVKIGDEAIIRRRIKGSKLFPRRKRKIRELEEVESDSRVHSTGDNFESPRLRLRPDLTGIISETYDDANECDVADKPWRPYYSYKSKKKRKKLRFKHGQALFHHYNDSVRTDTSADEDRLDGVLGGSGEVKRFHRSCSPRTTYNCDICDSSFITETGLRAHVIGSHPYFCRTCGKQGPPGETPGGNDYICNICMENGSCFDNSPRSPIPEKKFRCSFCPQRFLYLATKRSHEKKHQDSNEEGYPIRPCSEYSDNPSEDNNQNCIKTEEDDNQESSHIKYEEKGHFPIIKTKTEDTTELIALTNQDMTYTHIKRSLSSHTEPMFTLTPSKHKMKKHSLHRGSKQGPQRKDADRTSWKQKV